MDEDVRARRVVIAGAGIAGLAAALRLRRAGWDVLVVERAPGRRSSGYMVNLIGVGYAAAEQLGLLPELTARDLGVVTTIMVKADGRPKFTVPAAVAQAVLGERVLSVFRGDLESALYEAVHATAEIRFGVTVREIAQHDGGVSVVLSDGTSQRVDLVIGADGLHSGVREIVFGPERDFRVDLRHVVGAFPLNRVPEGVPDSAGTLFIGPGRTAVVANLGPGRSSAFFTYRSADPEADLALGAERALGAAFEDLGGGVPDALRQLRADPGAAYFDSVSQVVMDKWTRGRVVLLGDAAWCVTLFAGYGAALALAGADQLGAALQRAGDGIPEALAGWEAALRPEVHKRQAAARKGISQYAPSSNAQIWMRYAMIRAIQLPGIRGLVRRSFQRSNHLS